MPASFPRFDQLFRPNGHVFYGWWIVMAGAFIQLLSSLLWMQSYGAYVVLLQDEFGWSKTLIAGAFAMTRIESGILGPLQGWMVDRYGPRIVLQFGTVMYGVGFMLFSQIDSVLGFYLTFALIAVGSSLGGFATLMVAVVSWFHRHRSKAVAMSQLGFSVGGLCVPVVVLALENFGWRETAFVSGIIVIVIGLPLAQVIRHRPESFGEVPDGISDDLARERSQKSTLRGRDLTASEAMRTSAFWLIAAGHAIALLSVSTLMVHLISHLTTGPLGYSLAAAAGMVSLMTGAQITGQFIGGFAGDRFNKRFICSVCLLGHGSGLALVAYATAPWMVALGVMAHGLSWGTRGPLMTAMRADYFGAKSFGTIMGFSSLIVMLGMSLGPVIAGYAADVTGDFLFGFTLLACVSVLGAMAFAVAKPPLRPLE